MSLELKPRASLVYKPVEGLEVNNKVELPVKQGLIFFFFFSILDFS